MNPDLSFAFTGTIVSLWFLNPEISEYAVSTVLLPVWRAGTISTSGIVYGGLKKGAGFPMGPFELGDYVGLDIVYDVFEASIGHPMPRE